MFIFSANFSVYGAQKQLLARNSVKRIYEI